MADIRGSKILVIGGAGFIGSHIVDELIKEDVEKVIVYDNFCRGTKENLRKALRDPRVRVYDIGGDITQTDILDSAVNGIDFVFHLAALWLLQCQDYPRSAFETNISGTFNVIEACKNNKVKKLVYSSSASVYGDAVELPMTEEHIYNNRTLYGATKIAGEQMCRAFNERYGLDYIGLRYMNVYGDRQNYEDTYTSVVMRILNRVYSSENPLIYGDGTQSYDFVYVNDVAKANICALKSDRTDAFYNVGTGIGTTVRELCQKIITLTGSDLSIQYLPGKVSQVKHRIGSIKRAADELSFTAAVGLEEGLEKTIVWYKSDRGL